MRDTVIFDLDGTILDTLTDLTNAVNYALRTCGYEEKTESQVRSYVGNGIRNLMRRAVPQGTSEHDLETSFAQFKSFYEKNMYVYTRAYEGIPELMRQLSEKGYHIGVVSNKADFAVKVLMEQFFDGLVEIGVGEMDNMGRKPAPDTLFYVMQKMKVTPDRCIYVGDSDVDIRTAENAGIPCISVTWGFRSPQFLLENGAQYIADNTVQLAMQIEKIS